MHRRSSIVFALSGLLALAGPSAEASADDRLARPIIEANLASAIADDPAYRTFADLLSKTGVVATIVGAGPFTVFVPTEKAFAAMPPAKREVLFSPEHEAELKKLLRYHIVPGRIPPDEVASVGHVQALIQQVRITRDGRGIAVNGAPVVAEPVSLKNGVLYGIGAVLIPHYENLLLPPDH